MTFGTLSLGPPSKRFVATPLLRRNHFGQHNEVGRSIWRFEMGAQHRLSLSLTKRMAFYFLNLHKRLRNHKGAISQGGGGSLLVVLANRFCSYWRRPIDRVMAGGRGVATGRGVFLLWSVVFGHLCHSFFDWLPSDHFPFSFWILRSPDWIPWTAPPHLVLFSEPQMASAHTSVLCDANTGLQTECTRDP